MSEQATLDIGEAKAAILAAMPSANVLSWPHGPTARIEVYGDGWSGSIWADGSASFHGRLDEPGAFDAIAAMRSIIDQT